MKGRQARLKPHVPVLAIGLAAVLQVASNAALAEDTDTPGDGAWEIKVKASGDRNGKGWELAAPEFEINRGLGSDKQVTVVIPWVVNHARGEPARAGVGAATVAFKWRFLEREPEGFTLSVFPQYSWNLSRSSERRGIVAPGRQLVLPLEMGWRIGRTEVYPEVGRTFIQNERGHWISGIEIKHPCSARVECFAKLDHSFPAEIAQTSARVGVKWRFTDAMKLQAGIGREFGRHSADQRDLRLMAAFIVER